VPWPTCEEGYKLRKLTLFASQVVNDFKSIPSSPGGGPRKVVELAEDSPEILLEDLDLASWRHCLIYFLGVFPEEPNTYSEGRVYFNGDLDDENYYTQLLLAGGSTCLATRLNHPLGPPYGPDATQMLMEVMFSAGRVRVLLRGDNNTPDNVVVVMGTLVYAPTVDNLTSILFYSGSDSYPYRAGTRVEVW
jgi:hypothetical protein